MRHLDRRHSGIEALGGLTLSSERIYHGAPLRLWVRLVLTLVILCVFYVAGWGAAAYLFYRGATDDSQLTGLAILVAIGMAVVTGVCWWLWRQRYPASEWVEAERRAGQSPRHRG